MRTARALTLAAGMLGLSAAATATPVYYTFTGAVTFTQTWDPTTSSYLYNGPVNGLAPGDSVSYTFAVDLGQQAVHLYGNPTPTTSYVFADDAQYDYILAGYVSGDAFPRTPLDGTRYNSRLDYGYRFFNGTGESGYLVDQRYAEDPVPSGGTYFPTRYDQVSVAGSCGSCGPSFALGQTFTGSNLRFAQSTVALEQYEEIQSFLTLTDISGAAVPEPGTLLLLGGGLVGLTRVRRRK